MSATSQLPAQNFSPHWSVKEDLIIDDAMTTAVEGAYFVPYLRLCGNLRCTSGIRGSTYRTLAGTAQLPRGRPMVSPNYRSNPPPHIWAFSELPAVAFNQYTIGTQGTTSVSHAVGGRRRCSLEPKVRKSKSCSIYEMSGEKIQN